MRDLLLLPIILAIAGCAVLHTPQLGKNPECKRSEMITNSPNYRDGSFQNIEPTSQSINVLKAIRKFVFESNKNTHPQRRIPTVKTDIRALNPDNNLFIWFGHSSYYLQVNGNRFLVDPVFNGYASPVSFINKAFEGTNIYSVKDMPHIDYLIITHDHYDHLDYKTVTGLREKIDTVICPLGVGSHFEHWGFDKNRIVEKDWNEVIPLANESTLYTVTSRHFSGRSAKRNQTLWSSFILKTAGFTIFMGCDGGYGKHFAETGHKYGPFDLAFLENGQYNDLWPQIHAFPEENLQIAKDLNALKIMPLHSGKFSLSSHDWDEPLKMFTSLADSLKLNILTPKIGEPVNLNAPDQTFTRWWEYLEKQ